MGLSWLALGALVWAAVALTVQGVLAWRGKPPVHSARAGSRVAGVIYGFTWAMLPTRKESMGDHPVAFSVGLIMHGGALVGLGLVPIAALSPEWSPPVALGLALLVPLAAGLFLLIRRLRSANLRAMSDPDDYVSVSATIAVIAAGASYGLGADRAVLLLAGALVLAYVPVGKLRHAVFFFLARGEYAARLGYRGVYPASREERP